MDRYGDSQRSFLAPQGTAYEQCALAPGSKANGYYEYDVIKALPVLQGEMAQAFVQPVGGIQIFPNMHVRVNVQWLLDNNHIKKVNLYVANEY